MADRKIESFNEGGLDGSGKALRFQYLVKITAFSPAHAGDGKGEFAMLASFDQLSMQQPWIDLPMILTRPRWTKPLAKVGGQSREVGTKAIGVFIGVIVAPWLSFHIVPTPGYNLAKK